ncbi:MAG: hypothetical protein WCK88_00350 [bacterium]
MVIQQFEIWYDTENQKLLQKVEKQFDTPINGVPLTLIGDAKIVGYSIDTITGKQIDEAIQYCLKNTCTDLVGPILSAKGGQELPQKSPKKSTEVNTQVTIPGFGVVQLKDFSLPVVTIIL